QGRPASRPRTFSELEDHDHDPDPGRPSQQALVLFHGALLSLGMAVCDLKSALGQASIAPRSNRAGSRRYRVAASRRDGVAASRLLDDSGRGRPLPGETHLVTAAAEFEE